MPLSKGRKKKSRSKDKQPPMLVGSVLRRRRLAQRGGDFDTILIGKEQVLLDDGTVPADTLSDRVLFSKEYVPIGDIRLNEGNRASYEEAKDTFKSTFGGATRMSLDFPYLPVDPRQSDIIMKGLRTRYDTLQDNLIQIGKLRSDKVNHRTAVIQFNALRELINAASTSKNTYDYVSNISSTKEESDEANPENAGNSIAKAFVLIYAAMKDSDREAAEEALAAANINVPIAPVVDPAGAAATPLPEGLAKASNVVDTLKGLTIDDAAFSQYLADWSARNERSAKVPPEMAQIISLIGNTEVSSDQRNALTLRLLGVVGRPMKGGGIMSGGSNEYLRDANKEILDYKKTVEASIEAGGNEDPIGVAKTIESILQRTLKEAAEAATSCSAENETCIERAGALNMQVQKLSDELSELRAANTKTLEALSESQKALAEKAGKDAGYDAKLSTLQSSHKEMIAMLEERLAKKTQELQEAQEFQKAAQEQQGDVQAKHDLLVATNATLELERTAMKQKFEQILGALNISNDEAAGAHKDFSEITGQIASWLKEPAPEAAAAPEPAAAPEAAPVPAPTVQEGGADPAPPAPTAEEKSRAAAMIVTVLEERLKRLQASYDTRIKDLQAKIDAGDSSLIEEKAKLLGLQAALTTDSVATACSAKQALIELSEVTTKLNKCEEDALTLITQKEETTTKLTTLTAELATNKAASAEEKKLYEEKISALEAQISTLTTQLTTIKETNKSLTEQHINATSKLEVNIATLTASLSKCDSTREENEKIRTGVTQVNNVMINLLLLLRDIKDRYRDGPPTIGTITSIYTYVLDVTTQLDGLIGVSTLGGDKGGPRGKGGPKGKINAKGCDDDDGDLDVAGPLPVSGGGLQKGGGKIIYVLTGTVEPIEGDDINTYKWRWSIENLTDPAENPPEDDGVTGHDPDAKDKYSVELNPGNEYKVTCKVTRPNGCTGTFVSKIQVPIDPPDCSKYKLVINDGSKDTFDPATPPPSYQLSAEVTGGNVDPVDYTWMTMNSGDEEKTVVMPNSGNESILNIDPYNPSLEYKVTCTAKLSNGCNIVAKAYTIPKINTPPLPAEETSAPEPVTSAPEPVETATSIPESATSIPESVETATSLPEPVETATSVPAPVETATSVPAPVETETAIAIETKTATKTETKTEIAKVLPTLTEAEKAAAHELACQSSHLNNFLVLVWTELPETVKMCDNSNKFTSLSLNISIRTVDGSGIVETIKTIPATATKPKIKYIDYSIPPSITDIKFIGYFKQYLNKPIPKTGPVLFFDRPTDLIAVGKTEGDVVTAGIAKFPDNCKTKMHTDTPRHFYRFERGITFKLNGKPCSSILRSFYPYDPNNPPVPQTVAPPARPSPAPTPGPTPAPSPAPSPTPATPNLCTPDSISVLIREGFYRISEYLTRDYTASVDGFTGEIKYKWKVTPVAASKDAPKLEENGSTVSVTFPTVSTVADKKYSITCTIEYMQGGIKCSANGEYIAVIEHTKYDIRTLCTNTELIIRDFDETTYDFPEQENMYLCRKYIADVDTPYDAFLGRITYAWSVTRKTKIGTNTAAVPSAQTDREYIVKYTTPNVSYRDSQSEEYTVTCKATVNFGIPGVPAKTCTITGTKTSTIPYKLVPVPRVTDPLVQINMTAVTAKLQDKKVLRLDTIPLTLVEFLRQMKTGGTQMRDVIKRDIQTYDTEHPDALLIPPGLTEAQQDKLLQRILKLQPVGQLIDKYMMYAAGWKGATTLTTPTITQEVIQYSGSIHDINGDELPEATVYDPNELRRIFTALWNELWRSFEQNRKGGDNKALLRHLIYDLFRAMVLQYTGSAPDPEGRVNNFIGHFKLCVGDIPIYDILTTNNGVITQKLHWTKASGTKGLQFSVPSVETGAMEKRITRDKDKLSNLLGIPDFNAMLRAYALDTAVTPSYPRE